MDELRDRVMSLASYIAENGATVREHSVQMKTGFREGSISFPPLNRISRQHGFRPPRSKALPQDLLLRCLYQRTAGLQEAGIPYFRVRPSAEKEQWSE